MSCDRSRRVGRRPPRLPPRPQASAQTWPLHGGTPSLRGGGPRGALGSSLGGSGSSPHFRAGGGDRRHLQRPTWRVFCTHSNCCRGCPSLNASSRPPKFSVCSPWARGAGGCWPTRAALRVWRGSKSSPGPASPRCSPLLLVAPSPTQTPSLPPGPLPGPQIAPGSPPDGSAAPAQRARFGVTWQGPGEEEIHLYNKSTNVFWHTSSSLDIYQVF